MHAALVAGLLLHRPCISVLRGDLRVGRLAAALAYWIVIVIEQECILMKHPDFVVGRLTLASSSGSGALAILGLVLVLALFEHGRQILHGAVGDDLGQAHGVDRGDETHRRVGVRGRQQAEQLLAGGDVDDLHDLFQRAAAEATRQLLLVVAQQRRDFRRRISTEVHRVGGESKASKDAVDEEWDLVGCDPVRYYRSCDKTASTQWYTK
mmetsp:Transcript_2078/g.5200  ORF Transcript_2078/g.5200 Transcript_2078/m.5200 type:complete len:209 (+) Transcript_2078:438-1064(+)